MMMMMMIIRIAGNILVGHGLAAAILPSMECGAQVNGLGDSELEAIERLTAVSIGIANSGRC